MIDGAELKRVQDEFNSKQTLRGAMLLIASPFLWLVSYVVVWILVRMPIHQFNSDRLMSIAPYITWGVMLLLVVEGFRYRGRLFDSDAEVRRFDGLGRPSSTGGAFVLNYVEGPLLLGHIISQVLLYAPRSVVDAMKAFGMRLHASEKELESAAQVMNAIGAKGEWVPAEHFSDRRADMELLLKLKMVRAKVSDGLVDVRLEIGLEEKYYGRR